MKKAVKQTADTQPFRASFVLERYTQVPSLPVYTSVSRSVSLNLTREMINQG